MFDFILWQFWKRRVKKIPGDQCGECPVCGKPVYPGDLIVMTTEGEPVHAGVHWSLEKRSEFCETGAMGSAIWSAEGKPEGSGPSAIEVAAKTGRPVFSLPRPDGVRHVVIDDK